MKTKINPVQAWGFCGDITTISRVKIGRHDDIPVTILHTSDYKAMKKELRELRKYNNSAKMYIENKIATERSKEAEKRHKSMVDGWMRSMM